MMLLRYARALAFDHLRKRSDVVRISPATAAHKVYPPMIDETFERRRHAFRRFKIDAVFVGQARVRHTRHPNLDQLSKAANAIGHELGPRRAVQPYRQQIGMHH